MSLNPSQFKGPLYHGTTYDLQGKDIKPAARVSHPNMSVWGDLGHSGQQSKDHAFATESEDTAWQFASQAGMMKRSEAVRGYLPPTVQVGRVRVHEVAPHPLMRPGVYHADHPAHDGGEDLQEWVAPSFRSKGTIDTMPGRQGTFPQLNWNQFKSDRAGYAEDANHPSDQDISMGHGNRRSPGKKVTPVEPVTDEHQMDMFSGRTVGDHAENDSSKLGDYHRNNLFGRL